jgi:hypothetical protein
VASTRLRTFSPVARAPADAAKAAAWGMTPSAKQLVCHVPSDRIPG